MWPLEHSRKINKLLLVLLAVGSNLLLANSPTFFTWCFFWLTGHLSLFYEKVSFLLEACLKRLKKIFHPLKYCNFRHFSRGSHYPTTLHLVPCANMKYVTNRVNKNPISLVFFPSSFQTNKKKAEHLKGRDDILFPIF